MHIFCGAWVNPVPHISESHTVSFRTSSYVHLVQPAGQAVKQHNYERCNVCLMQVLHTGGQLQCAQIHTQEITYSKFDINHKYYLCSCDLKNQNKNVAMIKQLLG